MKHHDKLAASLIVRRALKAGYSVSVHDSEEWTLKRSRDYDTIMAALGTTGEDTLRLRDSAGEVVGSLYLVWGNGPGELVADCTDNPATLEVADLSHLG